MTPIDSAWKVWFRSEHDRKCLLSGSEFENYVTEVLKRLHSDYVNPDSMGQLGDEGCDGLADGGTIFYACYGSTAKTNIDSSTSRKLLSDFDRALNNWQSFTTWRFVTNVGFGPTPTHSLTELQQAHSAGSDRPLRLELWKAPDDLWWNAVSKLSTELLNQVLPGVPHYHDVELSDLTELLEVLGGDSIDSNEALKPIRPVPVTKMDYNGITEKTRIEFNEGRCLSHRIDRWFSEQAQPNLRDEKARAFRKIYTEIRKSTDDSQEIVERVYVALGGANPRYSTRYANAVYAITVYFFDSCDIFEEPTEHYQERAVANASSD